MMAHLALLAAVLGVPTLGLSTYAWCSMSPGLPRGMAIGLPVSLVFLWMPAIVALAWWLS